MRGAFHLYFRRRRRTTKVAGGIHLKFVGALRDNSGFFRDRFANAPMPNGIAEGRYMDTSDRFLFFPARAANGYRVRRAHRHARYFRETTLRYRARMHASATCSRALYPGTHQTSICSIFVNVFFSLSRCIRPVRLFH